MTVHVQRPVRKTAAMPETWTAVACCGRDLRGPAVPWSRRRDEASRITCGACAEVAKALRW